MGPRPFIDLLREHRGGQTHQALTDKLNELVAAVVQEQRGGTLNLKLTLKPRSKGDGIDVYADVTSAPPKEAAGMAIFFPTPEGNLVRQDPRQQTMSLEEVPPTTVHKALA